MLSDKKGRTDVTQRRRHWLRCDSSEEQEKMTEDLISNLSEDEMAELPPKKHSGNNQNTTRQMTTAI